MISPILANLFLHYTFDKWLQLNYSHVKWCRYADDGLIHCKSEAQATLLLRVIGERFRACGLELHPEKTKIVYCKDDRRRGHYRQTSFDFLGYTFRRRSCRMGQSGRMVLGFVPAVSTASLKEMRRKIRKMRIRSRTALSIEEIASWINPVVRGWLQYYGAFYRSEMYRLVRHVNKALVRWATRKFRHLRGRKSQAIRLFERMATLKPRLFVHWEQGMQGAFA